MAFAQTAHLCLLTKVPTSAASAAKRLDETALPLIRRAVTDSGERTAPSLVRVKYLVAATEFAVLTMGRASVTAAILASPVSPSAVFSSTP
jgi:hypothetical protein